MTARDYVKFILRALKYRVRLNAAELSHLGQWLRPSDFALDIGAHKGGMLYWLRRCVGAQGRVIAFEPQPLLARYLGEVASAMRWRNVTVEHAAVGAAPGSATLFVPGPPGYTSAAASLNRKEQGEQQALAVPMLSLDSYFAAAAHRRVAFIKCDCEGNELDVFKGGEQLLRRDRPVLLFECEQRHLRGRTPLDVFAFLESLGYRGRFFLGNRLVPVSEFRLDVHQRQGEGHFWGAPGYVGNFVFEAGNS